MKRERALAYAAFAIVCVVWGTTYLAIRIAVETIPPLLLMATRYTAAGLILFIASRIRGEALQRAAHGCFDCGHDGLPKRVRAARAALQPSTPTGARAR